MSVSLNHTSTGDGWTPEPMRVVWKFVLMPMCEASLSVPNGGKVVHVGRDHKTGNPAIWIEFKGDPECTTRRFYTYATGYRIDPTAVHVGTAICGDLVWHVYELGAK